MDKIYEAVKDKFIKPKPYASWILDGDDDWQAPVTGPNNSQANGYEVEWNESETRFDGIKESDNSNHRWDSSGSAWIAL